MAETEGLPTIEIGEPNNRSVLVTLSASRVTGFTPELPASEHPTVAISTVWDIPQGINSPSVAVISPGLVQTLEDSNTHPFLRGLRHSMLERGLVVVRYEDAGARGSGDPAFKAYSLPQFSENLYAVAQVATAQPWFTERSRLVFLGFSSGCHSVLNEISCSFRSTTIQPAAIVLVSPLATLTGDINRYLNRDQILDRRTKTHVVSFLYESSSKKRTVEIPGDFFVQSELSGAVQLSQALAFSDCIPVLIVRPRQDKFSGVYMLESKGGNITDTIINGADHDMTENQMPHPTAVINIFSFLEKQGISSK